MQLSSGRPDSDRGALRQVDARRRHHHANVGAGSTELLFVPGSVLIKSGNEVLGAIGVSASPLSIDDERCAAAGTAQIQTALSGASK